MTNLKEAINKLNASKEYDGEIFESEFNFIIREENGIICIVDTKENYSIDYLDEQNELMRSCAWEFGFKFKPILVDEVMDQLETAVKADFGKDAYIEWNTNIEMHVAR